MTHFTEDCRTVGYVQKEAAKTNFDIKNPPGNFVSTKKLERATRDKKRHHGDSRKRKREQPRGKDD